MAVAADGTSLLTSSEAAVRLGVSTRRVRQLAQTGALLPAMSTPIGRLFDEAEIERLATERAEAGAPDLSP